MRDKNAGLSTPAEGLQLAGSGRNIGTLRRAMATLGAVTACTIGLWAPTNGFAQEPEGEAAALEEIVITGSRIRRANLETASPITALPAEEFKYQGTSAVES